MLHETLTRCFAAACLAFACLASGAESNYPSRPIRLISPYAPSGSNDAVARLIGGKLAEALGQQIVVDNRPGGNGNLALQIVAASAPDGYTLLIGANGPIAINPQLYSKLPVDPVRDFAAVGLIAASPMVLVSNQAFPANSVSSLIAMARSQPGTINYASAGTGSTGHLASELLKAMAGIDMIHIPYRGSGPAVVDVMSGQVQVMFTGASSTLPHIRAGRLKPLGVSSAKRLALLPDVQAVSEVVPGYNVLTWYGIFAPARTPGVIVARLNRSLADVLGAQDARGKLAALGADAMSMEPAQFAAMVRAELATWEKLVKTAGIRIQ